MLKTTLRLLFLLTRPQSLNQGKKWNDCYSPILTRLAIGFRLLNCRLILPKKRLGTLANVMDPIDFTGTEASIKGIG